jgi:hypothetical protein
MRTHVNFPEDEVRMPANLLKSCKVIAVNANGEETEIAVANNRKVCFALPLPEGTVAVRLADLASWGGKEVRFFGCDAAR